MRLSRLPQVDYVVSKQSWVGRLLQRPNFELTQLMFFMNRLKQPGGQAFLSSDPAPLGANLLIWTVAIRSSNSLIGLNKTKQKQNQQQQQNKTKQNKTKKQETNKTKTKYNNNKNNKKQETNKTKQKQKQAKKKLKQKQKQQSKAKQSKAKQSKAKQNAYLQVKKVKDFNQNKHFLLPSKC